MVITVKELKSRLDQFPDEAIVADVIDEETLADIFGCCVITTGDDGK